MSVTATNNEAELKDARILWLSRNRGALKDISKFIGLHKTTVRRVFYGEITSRDNRVEKELARRGAPGFTE
jgi:hypothetical protein